MNATIATIEMIANVVHINATIERINTINIDENDVSVINTNADMNATIANAININATNERINTINIDENDVSVINTNANTNVTKEIITKKTTNTSITITSNEENDKKKKRKNVVTINSNDEKMKFDFTIFVNRKKLIRSNKIRKRLKRKIRSQTSNLLRFF
jgi:hypothetical protein